MTADLRSRCRAAALGALMLLMMAATPGLAQGPSDPMPIYPQLPPAESVPVVITDLEQAPAIAQESILQLVGLGVYPLTPSMEALPNEPLDSATASFMLINLFAPGLGDEFPVPPGAAVLVLSSLVGTDPPPDAVWTAGTLRDFLLAVLDLAAEEEDELRAVLNERYPALQAGNPDAPLTRAGAALMLTIALDHLTAEPS